MTTEKAFAMFEYYQELPGRAPIAYFKVMGHPTRHESHLPEKMLKRLGIRVPTYPSYHDWKEGELLKEDVIEIGIKFRNLLYFYKKSIDGI